MGEGRQGEINTELRSDAARLRRWLGAETRSHVGGLIVAALLLVAAAVWRKPDVLVALTSLTFCAVALAIALVCLRLHKRARSQLLEAQQDVQRLERLNLTESRSHLMLEESIGHILLAWSGSSASVRALDRTMPRNNVVKSAVRELQSRGSLSSTGLKGAHSLIERANTALARVEAEIGPDRVEQTITLSFTTRGERVVTTAPAVEDGPQRAP